MDWFKAQQQFNADLLDGTQVTIHLGQTLPGSHELVQRDLDGAAAAAKAGTDRAPLFEKLDTGEDEAPKPRARGKGGS